MEVIFYSDMPFWVRSIPTYFRHECSLTLATMEALLKHDWACMAVIPVKVHKRHIWSDKGIVTVLIYFDLTTCCGVLLIGWSQKQHARLEIADEFCNFNPKKY